MSKKVLVLGATGAMGQYLVPVLAGMGYEVDAVALDLYSLTQFAHGERNGLRKLQSP